MAFIDLYSEEELRTVVANSTCLRDVLIKLGYATTSGDNHRTLKNRIERYGIDISHFKIKPFPHRRTPEDTFVENSTASQHSLRRLYLSGGYTPYRCSVCGQLPEQNDKPLTLILDHINGNNKDDRIENLRWVCPNCNQQLDTTGFRNPYAKNVREKLQNDILEVKKIEKKVCPKCGNIMSSSANMCKACQEVEKKSKNKPPRDILKNLVRTNGFVKIGTEYGVTDRAVAKWCKSEGLPYRRTDIKKISDEEWEKL